MSAGRVLDEPDDDLDGGGAATLTVVDLAFGLAALCTVGIGLATGYAIGRGWLLPALVGAAACPLALAGMAAGHLLGKPEVETV